MSETAIRQLEAALGGSLSSPSAAFEEALLHAAKALQRAGRARAAASAHLYRGDIEAARRLSADVPLDLARCASVARAHRDAALAFAKADWFAHAARSAETAKDWRGASAFWERVAERARDDAYVHGLARYNIGRTLNELGQQSAARKHVVAAMHLLSSAADGFEQQGLRERAFDCFGVLLSIGRFGAFENLAEGYSNCIRILKEDGLRDYALQYFDDFAELAIERRELHAAASIYRDAAEFSGQMSLPYERHYRKRSAECLESAADHIQAKQGSPELAELARLSAIEGWSELGCFAKVRVGYEKAARDTTDENARRRFERLIKKLERVSDSNETIVSPSRVGRREVAYPEVWIWDLMEWEQAGDPAESMADIAYGNEGNEYLRRRALLVRLMALADVERDRRVLESIATHLGRVELYVTLAPLERLLESDDARVRAAVLRSIRRLFFKRSFGSVARGLADPDPQVRAEALAAVQTLHFVHAFDPLSRVHREARDPNVRRAALASIGKISSLDAVEYLIATLRQGSAEERSQARDLLVRSEFGAADSALRAALSRESPPLSNDLQKILLARRS